MHHFIGFMFYLIIGQLVSQVIKLNGLHSWNDGKQLCEDYGTGMVIIENEETEAELINFLESQEWSPNEFWIGLICDPLSENFTWINNKTLGPFDRLTDNSHECSKSNTINKCVHVHKWRTTPGRKEWVPVDCETSTYEVLCYQSQQSNTTADQQSNTTAAQQSNITTATQSITTSDPQSNATTAQQSLFTTTLQPNTTPAPQSHTTTAQQSTITTAPQLNTTTAQQSSSTTTQQSTTSTAQQSTNTMAQQSTTEIAQQSTTSTAQQSSTSTAQQSTTVFAQQLTTTTAQQSTNTTATRSNTATALQSNTTTAQRSTITIAPQPNTPTASLSNTSIAQQSSTTTTQQSTNATARQLTTATAQQSTTSTVQQPTTTTAQQPKTATAPHRSTELNKQVTTVTEQQIIFASEPELSTQKYQQLIFTTTSKQQPVSTTGSNLKVTTELDQRSTNNINGQHNIHTTRVTSDRIKDLSITTCVQENLVTCECNNIRNTSPASGNHTSDFLYVIDKTKTSAYIRRLHSAYDGRVSSILIGCTGVAVIIFIVGCIVCSDIQMYILRKPNKKKYKRKPKIDR